MNRRVLRQLVVGACIAGIAAAPAAAAEAAPLAPTMLPAPLGSEAEPNESPAQASPAIGDQRLRAALAPVSDVDHFGFEAKAGDRVFANLVTAADTRLTLLASDGLTPIEVDEDDGTQFASASSIAGAEVPADGRYYLRVEDSRGAAAAPASYDLYLALRAGTATPEAEPNDEFAQASPLVAGQASGSYVYEEPATGDKDWFAFGLQAGDTVFLSLDLDPERDGEAFDGQLGFGLAGDVRPEWPQTILSVDDLGVGDPADPPSEAETMTVSQAGTYYAYVDVGQGKVEAGGATDTYELAVSVFPATQPSCRTYPSALTSAFLDGGTTSFPIHVDDPALVARAAVRLRLEATVMADLDVSLRSPGGTELPLFTDVGETAPGGQRQLEAVFDDFAAMPPVYTSLRPLGLRADSPLAGFAGQQAAGTWTLVVVDDTANAPASVGNLAGAELVLCPGADPPGPPGGEPEPPGGDPEPPGGGPGQQPPAGGAAGSGGGGGAQPQPQLDRPAQPPLLASLRISPRAFRAAEAGPMTLARRPRAGGALVRYWSSEAAQVNFVLFELADGRRVGRACVRPTASNAGRKPCLRPVKVIDFRRAAAAGANRFGFSGRVGARELPPGEYRLRATAHPPSGLASAPLRAPFTVLPAAPRR